MISSSALRITGTAGKKNDFSGFCGGVSEKAVILQAENQTESRTAFK